MFIAWDADGNIIATLESLVYHDPATGELAGAVDMQMHEVTGGRMREVAGVAGAAASGTWIEELGAQAHDFRVELDPAWTRENDHPFAVLALVHVGHPETIDPHTGAVIPAVHGTRVKRKRVDAEKRILAAVAEARERGGPVDLQSAVGRASVRPDAPDRHLRLGPDGRDAEPISVEPVEPPFPLLRPRRMRRAEPVDSSTEGVSPLPDARPDAG